MRFHRGRDMVPSHDNQANLRRKQGVAGNHCDEVGPDPGTRQTGAGVLGNMVDVAGVVNSRPRQDVKKPGPTP